MALDPTIEVMGHANLKQIAEGGAYTNAQRQNSLVAHLSREDTYAELAHQNAIANQQLATQTALDHANELRAINKMFIGALANKFINQDVEQAIADSQVMKGSADSTILSILGQLSGGQLGAKVAQSTPYKTPDVDFASALAYMNTLNQQNYSNNTVNRDLAAVGAMLAEIVMKNATMYPVPSASK